MIEEMFANHDRAGEDTVFGGAVLVPLRRWLCST
jgi:hypothetical protein